MLGVGARLPDAGAAGADAAAGAGRRCWRARLAFSSAGLQAAIIAGPALGGLIYIAGAGAVYATCAALFAVGRALCLADPLRTRRRRRATRDAGTRCWPACTSSASSKVVLGAISLDLFAVLLGGATALLPMFAKDILHVGPMGLGLLRALAGGGRAC